MTQLTARLPRTLVAPSIASEPLQSAGLLLLRVVPAVAMASLHGWGKLQALLAGAEGFPDPLGVSSPVSAALAVSAEVGASILVALGLFTRLAVLPLMFTMLVAIFSIHAGQPWSAAESAMIYLTLFTVVGALGPGSWSLDGWLAKRV